MQRIRNTLAMVVIGSQRRDHITPVLQSLHWLPVAAQIDYKVALTTHKVLVDHQQQYLIDVVTEYKPTRDLRSSSQNRLTTSITKSKLIGQALSTQQGKFGTLCHWI